MRKQNSQKYLIFSLIALALSIVLSMIRVVILDTMVTQIQAEFPHFNVEAIIFVMILVGTILNTTLQAWILYTICKIMYVKSSFIKSYTVITFTTCLSLLLSQMFIKHNHYLLISAFTFALAYILVCLRLFWKIPKTKLTVLLSYGVIVGVIQVWFLG